MFGYSQHVAWSQEDGQFVAVCPELDNLMSLGNTEEEAVQELKVAISLLLEDMAESGENPPVPLEYGTYSGQFRIRIPRTLHGRLANQAHRERVSLNTLVCSLLSEASAQLTVSGYVSDRIKSTYWAIPCEKTESGWISNLVATRKAIGTSNTIQVDGLAAAANNARQLGGYQDTDESLGVPA